MGRRSSVRGNFCMLGRRRSKTVSSNRQRIGQRVACGQAVIVTRGFCARQNSHRFTAISSWVTISPTDSDTFNDEQHYNLQSVRSQDIFRRQHFDHIAPFFFIANNCEARAYLSEYKLLYLYSDLKFILQGSFDICESCINSVENRIPSSIQIILLRSGIIFPACKLFWL